MSIIRFTDGSLFLVEDVQERYILMENIMRPGMATSAVAVGKKALRDLEDMFDEDAPELRETLYVYPNETSVEALQMTLANPPEGVPGPAGADSPKTGFIKVGSVGYEKYRLPDAAGAGSIPEPRYAWRLTVEIGRWAYGET